ncbi:MAG: hypothetical protein FJ309_02665 [Planctomycetes bacterium]|nr:hypothetical protein [Planctomycetota bacterium]
MPAPRRPWRWPTFVAAGAGRRLDLQAATVWLAAILAVAVPAPGQEAPPPAEDPPSVGRIVVRLPISGTRDKQAMAAITRQVERLKPRPGQRGILVVEFAPGDEGDVSDFGHCFELARFLGSPSLAAVKTVAFLPQGIRGHAVLVALACEQIVIAPEAELGPAVLAGDAIDNTIRTAYTEIAGRHRTVPEALAVALVDPTARVVRAATEDGDQFVPADRVAALRETTTVLEVEDVGPSPLVATGRRARSLGLASLLAENTAELARGLGTLERALLADPGTAEGWNAAVIDLSGVIGGDVVARTQRRIERLVAEGVNFVCLRIDSRGGEPDQSLVLSGWLAGLDAGRVRTVAYVPVQARGDAGLVALACDDLVMGPSAVIGGPGEVSIGRDAGADITTSWRKQVAEPRGRSWSLPVALVRPDVAVHRATETATGRVEYFSPEELAERADRAAWQLGAQVKKGPTQLSAAEAEAFGLAGHVVEGIDGISQAYGIEGQIKPSIPGWAESLLEALASPELAWLLLLIGGAALLFELQTPGVGLGGFVATVAFVVYFWGQFLRGTSGSLEVMLFVVGLFCLAMEIFVFPGFGVLGLGGGLLMVAALVLASQSFVLPANDYQLRQLEWSLATLLGVAVGVAVLGVLMRRWLPAIPWLRDVIAEEPSAGTVTDSVALPAVGSSGTTTTRLAPAGKALFDGIVCDVASDGPLIEPGVAVTVVALRGQRVVVRAAVP